MLACIWHLYWSCGSIHLVYFKLNFGTLLADQISGVSLTVAAIFAVALRRSDLFIFKDVFAVSTVVSGVLQHVAILGALRAEPVVKLNTSFFSIDAVLSDCLVARHMVVVLYEPVNLDNAVFVSFDLLENMISLYFCQYFDYCLFESSPCHQRRVVWGSESFFSNFDFLDRLHAVANLVVNLVHEVSDSISSGACHLTGRRGSLEYEYVSLLSEVDFVEYFNARSP